MNNRLGDYYEEAIEGKIVLTKFLDFDEINQIKTIEKDGLKIYFYGGYDEAERVRAIIQYASYEPPQKEDFKINIYQATFNDNYSSIGHRNVLGSIMSLGIERNTFGDIYISENSIYLITSFEISKYLIQNMPLINHQNLKFNQVENIEQNHIKPDQLKTVNVASLRLDAVLARCLNLSRNQVTELIESGMVAINHRITKSITYKCSENEIISIRKYGRIKILENVKTTKKDRLVIKVGVKH